MTMAAPRLAVLALLAAAPAPACAGPLAAQDVPRAPTLLRVAASSDGTTLLSLDSAAIARTGDSTFVVNAVYHFPPDSARYGADGKMEMEAMDCGRTRTRGAAGSWFAGDVPVPVQDETPPGPRAWRPVSEDELPVFQAICGVLLGSFAASLPITVEAMDLDAPPELANGGEVGEALARGYPRALRNAQVGGAVLMRVRITAEGRADPAAVRVLWATRPAFAPAAVQVVQRMRWRPAIVDSRPADAWALLPVTYAVTR